MRIIATSSLIALGLVLSGCSSSKLANQSVDSVNQPVVQRIDYVMDVNTSGDSLSAGEASRIRGWLDSLRVGYGDRVSVDSGESGAGRSAINSVAALVGTYGLALATHAPVTQGVVAPGAMRVVVSRTTASVPGCSNQPEEDLANYNAATTRGYGCAVNSSLAAMVANPEDLIVGRSSDNGRAGATNAVNGAAINGYYGTISKKAGSIQLESTGGK